MNIQILICIEEEFEDAKGVIRIRKSKSDKQHNGLRKRAKGQQDKQRSNFNYFSI
jgi:peptidyl-tRNA hydrolase